MVVHYIMRGEKNRGQDHQHLLLRELKQSMGEHGINFRQLLLAENVNYYEVTEDEKRNIIQRVVQRMRDSPEGQAFAAHAQNRITEETKALYDSKIKRQLFMIDCFRESASFPLTKDRTDNIYMLQHMDKQVVNRELRKVIWSRELNRPTYRQQFSKWDGQVAPFKVTPEITLVLDRLLSKEGLEFKQSQKELGVRVMEYFVKKHSKLPQKYHYYLVINVLQLFNHVQMSRLIDVGAISVGLMSLAEWYHESNSQRRLRNILKVMQIVDEEAYNFNQENYLQGQKGLQSSKQLSEAYELFRVSLGRSLLSSDTCQFMVDQLLVRKRCKLDMYIMFAIVLLIISDQFEKQQLDFSLKEIISRTRSIVSCKDFVQAYRVIYEDIPAFYSHDDLKIHSNNRLLAQMLASQRREETTVTEEQQQEEEEDFVVELNSKARIGNK